MTRNLTYYYTFDAQIISRSWTWDFPSLNPTLLPPETGLSGLFEWLDIGDHQLTTIMNIWQRMEKKSLINKKLIHSQQIMITQHNECPKCHSKWGCKKKEYKNIFSFYPCQRHWGKWTNCVYKKPSSHSFIQQTHLLYNFSHTKSNTDSCSDALSNM